MDWISGDFVLGIDLGGTKIDIATAGPDGKPLAKRRLETLADQGAEQAIARALEAAATAAGELTDDGWKRCRMAAVVSPGIAHEGRVQLAPNLPGIEDVDLLDNVKRYLGVDVAVANDVKAGAVAEARYGSLRGRDPAIFLSLGTGLGAAVLTGGEVVTGVNGAAGEIAYCLGGVEDLNAQIQGRAPLEDVVGGRALGAQASAILGKPATAATALAQREGQVADLVEYAFDRLAVQVANMAILIDPAAIAVAGGLTGSSDRLLDALRRRLASAIPLPPELLLAEFAEDAALRGALSIALAKAGAPTDAEGPA